MEPVRLQYSEALVRRALGAFWRRTFGWRFVIAIGLVLASMTYSLAIGDRSWWIGVSGSLAFMGIAFGLTFYVAHFRGSMGRLRAMKSPEARFEPGEQRFRFTSDVGSSEMPWNVITEVWQFPGFWLLMLGRGQFITFPLDQVPEDARRFILERIRAHGGKVS